MQNPIRRLRWTEAYKLMEGTDALGKPKPFDIKFVCKDGTVDEIYGVKKTVSYNRLTGMRRLILANGRFRNIYDVLILQINDTRIIVK